MQSQRLEALLKQLADSQSQLSRLLTSVAGAQDWRPATGEWSFRFVAAHLATAETECFQDRIQRIAAGHNPWFEYYSNTGQDFSGRDLQASLKTWHGTRQAIFAVAHQLPEDSWTLTGHHAINGPITVWDVLVSMLAHDQEHLEELQLVLTEFWNEERPRNE